MNWRFFKHVSNVDNQENACTIHNLEDISGQVKTLAKESTQIFSEYRKPNTITTRS